ncbi:uncharacterized protein LOC142177653 [Nicotiana tabacum]|uniref:Uncharacterized protein LOC142177653 n=1 Tax=Nicotiana tabacum TaxID=4097 RepID=A0AC58U124_TOBAC
MRHEVPRFSMVRSISPLLLGWWENLSPSDKNHVKIILGNLPSLLDIQPNNVPIEAATMFWDEKRVVFRFGNIKMTSLLEEIRGFAGLPWDNPGLLVPENRTYRRFLKMMGLRRNDELVCLKKSYIHFDFLYERYGHNTSYRIYHDEFAITSLDWTHRRVFVFIVCFLGMIVFPIQGDRIHTRLAMVTKTLMEGIEGQTYTIVPMIVAEKYRALDCCKKGFRHFEGCNLLLKIWLLEHLQRGQYHQEFPQRPWNDHITFHHPKRMTFIPYKFAQPENSVDWVLFFSNLTDDKVHWMFEWFPTSEFIIRSRDVPHLVLIGLRGIYPYAPIRVTRQAGRKQVIPRVSKMVHYKPDFQGGAIPFKCEAQYMWHLKIIVEKDSIEPDRYYASHVYFYLSWLDDDVAGEVEPGIDRENRVIDDAAEAQVKYKRLRKRILESEARHLE